MKSTIKNFKLFISIFIIGMLLMSSVNSITKTGSVMEFLNNLFLAKNNEGSESEAEFLNYNAELAPAGNTNSTAAKTGIIIDGWIKIKSQEFKNKNKFPTINVDGEKFKIATNEDNFRINQAYDVKKTDADSPKSSIDFYVRLIKNLIYYSVNKKDINVIGTIEIKDVKETTFFFPGAKDDDLCFIVYDVDLIEYVLCAESSDIRNKWICKINIALGKFKTDDECNKAVKNSTASSNSTAAGLNLDNNEVIQPIIVIPLPSKECNQGWNYASHGRDWQCGCAEGFEQSPIDIPDKSGVIDSPVSPLFTFEAVPAKNPITSIDGELKSQEYIKIKYFKNAIRILHSNFGKVVTLDGSVFIGEEIVFHTPSEHKIGGKSFDVEMQVIFYGHSKGDIAKQVVLSFLFERKAGIYNKFLDDIDFFSLPNQANPERDITHDLYIPKIFFRSNDDNEINVKPFSFYTYQGSLTMPPCSEGTIHYVVADPVPLASVPIQLFQEAIRGSDSENSQVKNNRMTQPLNGRSVFFFDKEKYGIGELQVEKKPKKPDGHFEKVKRRIEDIFYVNDNNPSGIPGAFVVQPENK